MTRNAIILAACFQSPAVEKSGYVNVDELQAQTSLQDAAGLCGIALDVKGQGSEVRIDCPFGCAGDHCGRKEVAINVDNSQKVFMCHAYSCKFRGNLLTLMHGWLTGSKPASGRMTGNDFRRVKQLLATKVPMRATVADVQSAKQTSDSPPPGPSRNAPLMDAEDAKVRELHNLDEKFIVDVDRMNPAAASYVRRHPCLTSESMRKWHVGYLPLDGGSDKRGVSLRGNVIYPVSSEEGKVLAWVGRDPQYEDKERAFSQLLPEAREDKQAPAKHRFPKGFQRGLELFGQQTARLSEPGYREFIARSGVLVVEGFNGVILLDSLQIPAVGIMSNRMTDAQIEKVTQWSRRLGGGKVTLMFDCEQSGSDGAKEALWELTQRQLDVCLAWSPKMFSGKFAGCQPESLTRVDWDFILTSHRKMASSTRSND